jgi:hypothetical protein
MMENSTLRLDILPPAQRSLWDELIGVPPSFTLYGGTAIALYLGHRQSIDFDLFAFENFDPLRLYDEIPFLHRSEILQSSPNTLTCLVDRGAPVQVSFFGFPRAGQVRAPATAAGNNLKLASLVDLAGMKAATVQRRAEAKDYIDIGALLRAGVDLPTALASARSIYGEAFNPQLTLKALCYFDEPGLSDLSNDLRNALARAVGAIDLDRLPDLQPVRPRPSEGGGGG